MDVSRPQHDKPEMWASSSNIPILRTPNTNANQFTSLYAMIEQMKADQQLLLGELRKVKESAQEAHDCLDQGPPMEPTK
jgi:hypothetical protein